MDYYFWQDVLDTFQSLSDLLKVLVLIVPPLFCLALTALILGYRLAWLQIAGEPELVSSNEYLPKPELPQPEMREHRLKDFPPSRSGNEDVTKFQIPLISSADSPLECYADDVDDDGLIYQVFHNNKTEHVFVLAHKQPAPSSVALKLVERLFISSPEVIIIDVGDEDLANI